jgi:hypothetical protein
VRFSFLVTFCVIAVALAAACSDDEPSSPKLRPSGSSSSGGSDDDGGSDPDRPATFKDGVVPILATNCALAACHSSTESNLGIHLTYDKDQIYAELQKSSPTAAFNGAKFVVPGKPDESLLMAKMDGTQAKVSGCSAGCGKEMPPGDLIAQKDRDVVRAWIKAGAKNT